MATLIRPELSIKNKYWIDKHRYYELKHFCLQYPIWKQLYLSITEKSVGVSSFEYFSGNNEPSDPTSDRALLKAHYSEKIDLIERIAKESDKYLYPYILKAVTEDLSFTYLKTKLDIPCGRDMYYDRYRKFFWLLSEVRG